MYMDIDQHLIIALGELGQKEAPGDEDNPRISEYLKTVGMGGSDEIPWCAAYVNWCLVNSKVEGTGKPNAKSFNNWGFDIQAPRPGAITVFHRGSQAWQGHVGFFLDQTTSYVYLLGGNQENKVCLRPYSKSRLVGYRWSSEFY